MKTFLPRKKENFLRLVQQKVVIRFEKLLKIEQFIAIFRGWFSNGEDWEQVK